MKKQITKMIFMVTALLGAGLFTSCSSDDPTVVNKTELNAAIEAANLLISTTAEGTAAGNYLRGSQAELQGAINIAQVIADLSEAKKETVVGATSNLNAAIALYLSKAVVPIDPTNLAGHWTFDEITSTAANSVVKDYSGNNRNGAIKVGHAEFGEGNAALGTDRYGEPNRALLFDKGANVEIPYNAALNPASLSISVWVKLEEVRNNRFIGLQSWIGYKFEVQDGNRPFATIGYDGGAYDRDAAVAIGQSVWYHLVVTYTANSMVFYINGVAVKTWTDTPNPALTISPTYNLVLGCDFPTDKYAANGDNFDTDHLIPAAWGGYLHGYLDEVRIYKSVLTQNQVTSIYDLEKPN